MKKKIILLIFLITIIVVSAFIILNKYTKPAEAGSQHNVYGWAWSGNIGWISFNSDNCDVDSDAVYEGPNEGDGLAPAPGSCPASGVVYSYGVNIDSSGLLSGYAWSENIGWISFCSEVNTVSCPNSTSDLTGCPEGDCKAWIEDISCPEDKCVLSGWARALAAPEAGSNSGGWTGWIRLKDTNYKVWIDTSPVPPNPDEFQDWAWGGGGSDENNAIIGWVSFNCKEGGADGGYICGKSDYKVMTKFAAVSYIILISDPEARGMFCAGSPDGLVELSWKYDDSNTNPQSKYQLQVATDSGFSDSSIVVDVTNSQIVQPGDRGTAGVSIKENPGENELSYNTSYYWQVKVWDEQNNQSDWSTGNCLMVELNDGLSFDTTCFRTPKHPYPKVDFTWTPESPSVGGLVQFCSVKERVGVPPDDWDICSEPENDLTRCYDSDSECNRWNWTIPNWTPDPLSCQHSSIKNPCGKFTSLDEKNVVLVVCDIEPYCCDIDYDISLQLPLPEWKEIAPF